jgi:hypothetical protein
LDFWQNLHIPSTALDVNSDFICFFFFNFYFIFKLWDSVFHLFLSTGVASNCVLAWQRGFLFPGFLFDSFFEVFHIFVQLLFYILCYPH